MTRGQGFAAASWLARQAIHEPSLGRDSVVLTLFDAQGDLLRSP
jgi:hypothetical protein